jgi:antitoxin VapB
LLNFIYTTDAMALHIRDDETDRLVRRLAEHKGVGLTEAVRLAVENELRRIPLRERLRPMQQRLAKVPGTGLRADKAFFDDLSGDS